jgi:hypothetical protein
MDQFLHAASGGDMSLPSCYHPRFNKKEKRQGVSSEISFDSFSFVLLLLKLPAAILKVFHL